MDVRERVRAESERFRAALPALLESPLRGRWVIFLNGEVKADFASGNEAHDEAVRRFGYRGGFVVAQVKPQQVIWIPGSLRLE